jgi:predicted Zn finger-like uncharacterized protein
MLINCNKCKKKFVVPDSAITILGRLVQCSACGNKWTQFPLNKETELKVEKKITKAVKIKRNLYTEEYLKRKHGLVIGKTENKKLPVKKEKNNFGFYSYILIFIIFLLTAFGVLNLIKDDLIQNYPPTEEYINYLYEIIELLKILLFQLKGN